MSDCCKLHIIRLNAWFLQGRVLGILDTIYFVFIIVNLESVRWREKVVEGLAVVFVIILNLAKNILPWKEMWVVEIVYF